MFIEQLTQNEKKALMALLVSISKADGELSESELDFLSTYSQEYEVTLDINTNTTVQKACAEVQTYKSKIIALQEIVKLAIVDGNYDESEREGALAISTALGISLSKFEEIEAWVIDGRDWVVMGQNMLVEAQG